MAKVLFSRYYMWALTLCCYRTDWLGRTWRLLRPYLISITNGNDCNHIPGVSPKESGSHQVNRQYPQDAAAQPVFSAP